MKLVPRRNFDLFDSFFGNDDFLPRRESSLMKTDIKETDDKFIIEMDLPGYSKENIDLSLNNGYLEVSAKVERENNSDENEKYVRRERFVGECSRSFYVGEDITEEDIAAEFKDGILKIDVPKKDAIEEENTTRKIEIK